MMLPRQIQTQLQDDLAQYPAVALLGPRQTGQTGKTGKTGKTTVAREIAAQTDSIYPDLESERDFAKLAMQRMQHVAQGFARQHLAGEKLASKDREFCTLLPAIRS